MKFSFSYVSLLAMDLLVMTLSQVLPYNPTTLLQDPRSKNLVYVFERNSSSNSHQLLSIEISSTILASNISYNTVSQNLPFSNDDNSAFTPSISEKGDISIYTGFCEKPSTSTIWKFQIPSLGSKTAGEWAQGSINTSPDLSSYSLPKSNFLTRGITFSTLVDGNSTQTNTYIFGGMCPTENSTSDTSQSAAHYSNHMLRLTPVSDLNYNIDIITSRSSAVAEAGFSFTGLTPTYSNNSNVKIQQRNFVLIGGHTQGAFISMSQVAIWSLPEEAWNFVKVKMPLAVKPNTDQMVDTDLRLLDSRSGHTAVLTEDGSKIIVFGGWVGNTSQAAEPQLAILNLGTGYGGSGIWEWTIPADQPTGMGIYGHGAIMLPGNVMMVIGGLDISLPMKRALDPGVMAMFFNATSLSWATNYTNPEYFSRLSMHQGTSSLAIRIAVGLGLLAVAGTLLLCVGYKRHKKYKGQRENNIRGLSAIATNSNLKPHTEMRTTNNSVFPWSNNGWNHINEPAGYENPNQDTHGLTARYENSDLGVSGVDDFVYILPSTRQPTQRSSLSRSRGVYQPGNYETNGLGTAGAIHPIYEADENEEEEEEEDYGDLGVIPGHSGSGKDEQIAKRHSDPFKDPQEQPISPSVQSMITSSKTPESDDVARELEIKKWVSDWTERETIMNPDAKVFAAVGSVSPSRRATVVTASTPESMTGEEDNNSISNLSEKTDKSQGSSGVVAGRTVSVDSRSNSIKSFIMGINPFSTNNYSALNIPTNSNISQDTALDMTGPRVNSTQTLQIPGSAHSSGSGNSFRSAQTTAHTAVREDKHLEVQTLDSNLIENTPTFSEQRKNSFSGSSSKSKTPTLGKSRIGWFGSIKKAFVFSDDGNSLPLNLRNQSFHKTDANLSGHQDEKDIVREPHITVSAGGTLWRRKQGKTDWDDSNLNPAVATFGRSSSSDSTHIGIVHKNAEREEDNELAQAVIADTEDVLRVTDQNAYDEIYEDGCNIIPSASGRMSSSSVKSLKTLMKPSIREIIYTSDSEDIGVATVASLSEYEEDENEGKTSTRMNKGKQKVDGFIVPTKLDEDFKKYQPGTFEETDLSVPMEANNKQYDNYSFMSRTSRSSCHRKSRVLEIVERMESQT